MKIALRKEVLNNVTGEDFNLDYTKLADRMGIPVTTLWDLWNRQGLKEHVKVTIEVKIPKVSYDTLRK